MEARRFDNKCKQWFKENKNTLLWDNIINWRVSSRARKQLFMLNVDISLGLIKSWYKTY